MIETCLFPNKFVAIHVDGTLRRKFNVGDPCNVPGRNTAGRIKSIADKSVTVVTGAGAVRVSAQEFGVLNKDFDWGWTHVTSPGLGKMLWGDD